MTRPYRYLTTITNTNSSSSSSSFDQISAEPPEAVAVESDFVVILAALLCALICVLGLIAVARCAWLRRGSTATARRSPNTPAANKGMKKKTLESFPKFVYGEGKDEEKGGGESCMKMSSGECVICLTEYVDGDEIRVLPQCGHGFHVGCIDTWLGSHSSCPSCRQILVSTRCRKCGEFPAVSAGEGSTERKDGRRDNNNNNNINHDNSSSGSSEFLP